MDAKENGKRAIKTMAVTALFAGSLLAGLAAVGPAAAAPTAGGDLDPSFGVGGKVNTEFGGSTDIIEDIIVQPDGKIVAVGSGRPSEDGRQHFALARYMPNGSLDASFGEGGRTATAFIEPQYDTSAAYAVALQTDGKIVAVGEAPAEGYYHSGFAIARYNTDGSLDASFGSGGGVVTPVDPNTGCCTGDAAFAVAVQTDGKIVVAGRTGRYPEDFGLVRYNTDGSLDTSYGDGGRGHGDPARRQDRAGR
jgi:uncharacterized delta-60 repeat protein